MDVRQAMMFSGNIGEVARVALEEGAAGLSRFSLRLLSPVAPMLANSAEHVEEALERLGQAAFEYKLDGARIQVHKAGDEVGVFTRQLQDVTERVPEVVEWAGRCRCAELVLEGRGDRAATRRAAASLPGHDAAARPSKDVDAGAAGDAAVVLLLRLPLPGGRRVPRRAAVPATCGASGRRSPRRRCCRAS